MKNYKKTLARKLLSKAEVKKGTPIFLSDNWLQRKEAIAKRVANKIAKVKANKAKRIKLQEKVKKLLTK